MTYVVTGASGHVGGNLVRALLARGNHVRVVVHEESRAIEGLDVERVDGDVRDPASLGRAFRGADVVFHLAAFISISGSHGGRVEAINVGGARNVAEAALAAGVRRLVHCSSIHAYVLDGVERVDESSPRSTQPWQGAYDRSKAAGEREVQSVVARGLDAVIVNPTGVIGPLDFRPSRMGKVFLALHRRRLPALIDGGFDWVDVRDVVDSLLAAETRGQRGENYILSGRWLSVRDLAALAASVTGIAPPRLTTPMWLARIGAPFVTAFGNLTGSEPLYTDESLAALRAARHIDHTKAARELGHRVRPIEDTVHDTYEWFWSHGVLSREPRSREPA